MFVLKCQSLSEPSNITAGHILEIADFGCEVMYNGIMGRRRRPCCNFCSRCDNDFLFSDTAQERQTLRMPNDNIYCTISGLLVLKKSDHPLWEFNYGSCRPLDRQPIHRTRVLGILNINAIDPGLRKTLPLIDNLYSLTVKYFRRYMFQLLNFPRKWHFAAPTSNSSVQALK